METELLNLVRHMQAYPSDSLEAALPTSSTLTCTGPRQFLSLRTYWIIMGAFLGVE